jgi:hypothetical protein
MAEHRLAALAAAAGAGGGGLPLALWLLQTANRRETQAVVREFGTTCATAARDAVTHVGSGDAEGCLVHAGTWPLLIACAGLLLVAILMCLAACSGFLLGGGGGWWAARRFLRERHGDPDATNADLEAMATFIAVGSERAIRESALELQVPVDAIRDWWVHWQAAHRGPRRQFQ